MPAREKIILSLPLYLEDKAELFDHCLIQVDLYLVSNPTEIDLRILSNTLV